MKLNEKWQKPNAMVTYSLYVGGGLYSNSAMPASVALEIARNADELELCERDGVRMLRVSNREYLPAEIFDLEGEDFAAEGVEEAGCGDGAV